MGGGDDTEILLQFPFAEVHAFDLTNAVDRAARYLDDPRLVMSQASIYEIPYPDHSFDFVFCHRVLQHTPDPAAALRCLCRKVRPGGVLFAHSYKKSLLYLMNFKYKLRWFTKRLPRKAIAWYVDTFGPALHAFNHAVADRNLLFRGLVWNFIPFEHVPEYGTFDDKQLLELEKLITFDALTPWYDRPLSTKRFVSIIESEGFEIDHLFDPRISPVCCTAVKKTDAVSSSSFESEQEQHVPANALAES